MIEIRNLTKLYGSVIGVNDVSVDLAPGAHGLLGPTGAGKTTFLGLVTGQLRPTMGRVLVFGERPFGNPRVLRRIGFCPAADLGDRSSTPREWVIYLVRLSGFTAAAAAAEPGAAACAPSREGLERKTAKTANKAHQAQKAHEAHQAYLMLTPLRPLPPPSCNQVQAQAVVVAVVAVVAA